MPLKSNRKLALNKKDKLNDKYFTVESLDIEEDATYSIYVEGVLFLLLLIKQVFKNEDGSVVILYLVISDLTLTCGECKTIYHKRWKVEEYHLEESPTIIKTACVFV